MIRQVKACERYNRPLMSGERLREVGVATGFGATAGLLAERLELASLVSWGGDRSYIVLVGALLGAALGATRVRRWLPAVVLPLLVAWAIVAFTPLTRWMAAGLVHDQPPRHADAAVPLASGIQRDGDLTSGSLSRVVAALELVAAGHTGRLILTELPDPHPRAEPAVRRLMENLGVEAELIAVGPVSNTHDEAVAVAEVVRERGFERILLVSSPVHTRRAALAFEAAGVAVTPVAARETLYDLERLDRPDDRLTGFGPVVHERLGLAYYRWRGWIP